MRRAVLDPGVLVSALITPNGSPAKLLAQAHTGELELVVSPLLLGELEDVLSREKFRRYIDLDLVAEYMTAIQGAALMAADPQDPHPLRSPDPDDDYLIALANAQSAVLVSGDSDLLDLAGRAPICSPADFLDA